MADNDKITQAVLVTVVENNTKVLERIDIRLEKIDTTVNDIDKRVSVVETKHDSLKESVDGIRVKSNVWDGINSFLFAIAGAFAWWRQ